MLQISISYALRFHLICVTFLSHMRYIYISYAIEPRKAYLNRAKSGFMEHNKALSFPKRCTFSCFRT